MGLPTIQLSNVETNRIGLSRHKPAHLFAETTPDQDVRPDAYGPLSDLLDALPSAPIDRDTILEALR
jgi:hypothetical protein